MYVLYLYEPHFLQFFGGKTISGFGVVVKPIEFRIQLMKFLFGVDDVPFDPSVPVKLLGNWIKSFVVVVVKLIAVVDSFTTGFE